MHFTWSPFTGIKEKEGLLFPALLPLTCQEYEGELPPFTGVAVKFTVVPWQTGFAEAVTVTEAGRMGSNVMETVLEVAGDPVAQTAFDVRIQFTLSPLAGM